MFGAGLYFTDDFCKAAYYANRGDGSEAVVLLCRVVLGDTFPVRDNQPSRNAVRPPRKCGCAQKCKCAVYYNSIAADMTVSNRGCHREIVVYAPDQVYPEFMLELRPTALKPDPAPSAALFSSHSLARQRTPAQILAARARLSLGQSAFSSRLSPSQMARLSPSQVHSLRVCLSAAAGPPGPSLARLELAQKVEASIREMKADPESQASQERGCERLNRALGNVARQCADTQRAEAIGVVLSAMLTHPNATVMQQQGCRALGKLAETSLGVQTVADGGGINAV
eukprot:81331-Rhodomonas_salina.1